MISEICFKDYRFFKGEHRISFVCDKRTKKLLSNSFDVENIDVLKSIGVYGPNNSGKTNIIHVFRILKKVLFGDENFICNRSIFGDARTTYFSINFNNQDDKGWLKYEFIYDSVNKTFIREALYSIKYYAAGNPLYGIIFEKDITDKQFLIYGTPEVDVLSNLSNRTPLLYSLRLEEGKFSNLKCFQKSFQDVANSLEIISLYNIPIRKTIESLKSDREIEKKFILSFVKNADLTIENFHYKKGIEMIDKTKEIDEKSLSEFNDTQDVFHLMTRYNNSEVPSLLFDSSGTKKVEALASYIFEAISQGKILIVDEIDNGLHFKLTRAIVSSFNNIANKKGQLLFTAHDLLLIDCNSLLRKDQIYFVERDSKTTTLFRLKNITVSKGGPREGSSLLKRYIHGDFGKLPSPSFIGDILALNKPE